MNQNGNILTMLDTFVESVRLEKQAAEPTTSLYSANDAAAGLKPVVHGARFKENSADTKEIGVAEGSTYPASSENSADGTVGTTDADGAPELKTKKQPNEKDVFGKAGHLKNLGNTILGNLKAANAKQAATVPATAPAKAPETTPAAATAPAAQVKVASNEEKIANIVKTAAADADLYCDFLIGYSKGISKSANEGAMDELAGAAQGAGVEPGALDATMENGGGELSPEDLALLNELEAQGITLEDIAALLQSQGQEGGQVEPDADDMGGAEAMAEGMPQDDVNAAVQGADDITKAASILGVVPEDLFNTLFKKA